LSTLPARNITRTITMTTATLHYIHDPLCGWCYGAAPLLRAARELVPVVAHGGGMMTDGNRQTVSPQLRAYVMPHDQRIAQLTGQTFGAGYVDGLLRDSSAVLDSAPPITAMLAADQLGGRGLDMLARMQTAHYVEGRHVADAAVLADLAADIGLVREAFSAAFAGLSGGPTRAHIAASRALLNRVGGAGFPSFVLERDGHMQMLDIGAYLGQPEAWRSWLGQQVEPRASAS
jgi:putative protein-disulfide isomerase